jgi:cytochrome b
MPAPQAAQGSLVIVWDVPTRVFHLLLITAVAACWWSYSVDRMSLHRLCGYAAAGLLAFRFYWGFAGPPTARFREFLSGPKQAWRYLRGRGGETLGHNPLGGWSVLALLLLLGLQVASGLFSLDRAGLAAGPFSSRLSDGDVAIANTVHTLAFDGLLGLVGLHIAVVFLHLAFGDNLIGPMLHGRKRLPATIVPPQLRPGWAPIPGVALALLVTVGLWRLDSP